MTNQNFEPSVLVVARYPVGGIRTWMEYVYGHPAMADVRITILLPDLEESRALSRRLGNDKMQWHWTSDAPATMAKAIWRLLRSQRFDFVHAHGFSSGVITAITVPLRARLIITCHDVIEADQLTDWRGRLKRLALRASFRRADILHAVSGATGENLLMNFPSLARRPEKIRVVTNGIDGRRFLSGPTENLRQSMGWPDTAFVVGFFGRFMSQKGIRTLFDAVEQIVAAAPETDLRLLAVGTGGFKTAEQRYVNSRGLGPIVGFADFRPDIGSLLRGVDVVAMPSLWEACGLLAMEVLASGTPLICSDCPALVDIAAGSPARVVARRDAQALATAILEEQQSSTKQLALAYAATACERFDAGRAAEGIRKLYSL